MFIAALFTITRTWKQPRCPSTDDVHIFELACSIKNISICSIRNISIVHGESEVFPKTLCLNYGLQISREQHEPHLGRNAQTTLFLRILTPVGRQRTLWALHPPKCFTLPTSVFLLTFFFPPKTFCKSESEAEATFFSQIDMYNLLINFQPIFCV